LNFFKNKVKFRTILASHYPDFFFKEVTLEDLSTIKLDFNNNKKYVIKPSKGFFGIGVRVLDKSSNLLEISKDLKVELMNQEKYFDKDVISHHCFIIEEYLETIPQKKFENEEIAVDMFYDKEGTPVISCIYAHPIAAKQEYSNLLYYTSKALYDTFNEQLKRFFNNLKKSISGLKNFPLHAEFKVLKDQNLVPIEINPLRFGGFGLGDLPIYSFGYHPINGFFNDKAPFLDNLQEEENFCWFLAYNPNKEKYPFNAPPYKELTNFLGKNNILHFQNIDFIKYPVFGIGYLKATNELISRYLTIDFDLLK